MILKFIRGILTGGPFYLRLSRDRINVRNVTSGDFVEVSAKLGLDDSNIILSVGDPVDPAAVRVLTPFQHPRVLIDDYTGGEKIVQHAIRELCRMKAISPSPIIVLHPDLELAGGLTGVEARALREMAEGAGARKVFLHYGRPLTDEEVLGISTGELEEQW